MMRQERTRQRSMLYLIVFLGIAIIVGSCTLMPTGPEAAQAADDSTTDSLLVNPQPIFNSQVMIDRAVVGRDGWINIHNDAGGAPGEGIGAIPVRRGVSVALVVPIDPRRMTETLYAMLHIDNGTIGVFEYPGPDVPVMESGLPVSVPFTIQNYLDVSAEMMYPGAAQYPQDGQYPSSDPYGTGTPGTAEPSYNDPYSTDPNGRDPYDRVPNQGYGEDVDGTDQGPDAMIEEDGMQTVIMGGDGPSDEEGWSDTYGYDIPQDYDPYPEDRQDGDTIPIQSGVITIRDGRFIPESLEVRMGDTVIWMNDDDTIHTISGIGMTDTIRPGDSTAYTFTDPGMFRYRSAAYPAVEGIIVVR